MQSLLWELQAVSACNHPIKSCLVTQNVYQQTYGQPSLGQGAAIGEDLFVFRYLHRDRRKARLIYREYGICQGVLLIQCVLIFFA